MDEVVHLHIGRIFLLTPTWIFICNKHFFPRSNCSPIIPSHEINAAALKNPIPKHCLRFFLTLQRLRRLLHAILYQTSSTEMLFQDRNFARSLLIMLKLLWRPALRLLECCVQAVWAQEQVPCSPWTGPFQVLTLISYRHSDQVICTVSLQFHPMWNCIWGVSWQL